MAETPSSEQVRHNVRELLALLAGAEQQLAYERDVPVADVPAELLSGWFDDLYHPADTTFLAAFSSEELRALLEFNVRLALAAGEIHPLPASVVELHAHAAWHRAMRAASVALAAVAPTR